MDSTHCRWEIFGKTLYLYQKRYFFPSLLPQHPVATVYIRCYRSPRGDLQCIGRCASVISRVLFPPKGCRHGARCGKWLWNFHVLFACVEGTPSWWSTSNLVKFQSSEQSTHIIHQWHCWGHILLSLLSVTVLQPLDFAEDSIIEACSLVWKNMQKCDWSKPIQTDQVGKPSKAHVSKSLLLSLPIPSSEVWNRTLQVRFLWSWSEYVWLASSSGRKKNRYCGLL